MAEERCDADSPSRAKRYGWRYRREHPLAGWSAPALRLHESQSRSPPMKRRSDSVATSKIAKSDNPDG